VLSLPLNITDSQNITATTFLHLHPVPSLFTTISHNCTTNPSVSVVNASSLNIMVADLGTFHFELQPFITSDALASFERGEIHFGFSTRPSSIRDGLVFDHEALSLRSNTGQRDSSTNSLRTYPTSSVVTPQAQSKVSNQGSRLSSVESVKVSPHSNQRLMPKPQDLSLPDWGISTSIEVTFHAYSKISRVASRLSVTFSTNSPSACQTTVSSDSPTLANGTPPQDGRSKREMRRIAIICAIILGSLAILIFLWAYFRLRNKPFTSKGLPKEGSIDDFHVNAAFEARFPNLDLSSEKVGVCNPSSSYSMPQSGSHPQTELIFEASPSGEKIVDDVSRHVGSSVFSPSSNTPLSSDQDDHQG
jgi:hypothetical protein